MADISSLLRKPSVLIKFIQLILAIIAVILLQDPAGIIILTKSFHRIALVYTVYCGYILLTPMHIIGRFMDVETPKTLALAWAFIGCILWLTAGSMLVQAYVETNSLILLKKYMDEFLASGIIGIINGFTFFAEVGLILKCESGLDG